MPKVRTELVKKIADNVEFKYDIHVNTDGEFYTTLPEKAVLMFENASIVLPANPNRREGKRGYIIRDTINELTEAVNDLVKEYLSTTIIYEALIIRYSIHTTCTYVKTPDGDIGPNGHYAGDWEGDKWLGGTRKVFANDSEPYGLEVFVKPLVKRILRYKSGNEKTEYSYLHSAGRMVNGKPFKLGEYGKWLDAIVGIGPAGNEKEMEYSEKMAEFFVNMIKSICKLNERIKDHIEPEALIALMNSGQKLLG